MLKDDGQGQPPSRAPGYRPEIDGLRAVAILSVLVFHLDATVGGHKLFAGGFIGVDVFFVISGYLITYNLLTNYHDGDIGLLAFYKRRILRIAPALIVVLFFCQVTGRYLLFKDEFAALSKDVVAGTAFVSNFSFWLENDYFARANAARPLLNLWSLSVEEQFYLLFPIALLFLIRADQRRLTVWLGLAIVVSLAYAQIGSTAFPVANFFLLPSRVWELMCGAILASLRFKSVYRDAGLLTRMMPAIGLVCITASVVLFRQDMRHPSVLTLIPVSGAMAIIWFASSADPATHLLRSRPLVALGLISYPLYLWHWPLLSFVYISQSGTPAWGLRLGAVFVSFVLAALTYVYIERRMRFGGNATVSTTGSIVFLVVAGLWGATTAARPTLQLDMAKGPMAEYCGALVPKLASMVDGCWSSTAERPQISMVGDSHAGVLYDGFIEVLEKTNVFGLVHHSCLPFVSDIHIDARNCSLISDAALEFLTSEKAGPTIVLVGYWAYLASGSFSQEGLGWRIASEITPAAAVSFKMRGNALLTRLRAAGKQVIIVLDTPVFPHDINRCKATRPQALLKKDRHGDCAITRSDFEAQRGMVDEILVGLAREHEGVRLFDPAETLCDDDFCYALHEDQKLYIDGDHLNRLGAILTVRKLLEKYPMSHSRINDR